MRKSSTTDTPRSIRVSEEKLLFQTVTEPLKRLLVKTHSVVLRKIQKAHF